MFLSSDHYPLHTRKPARLSALVLMAWAGMFVLYIVAPTLVDRWLWHLSETAFSWTGALLLPVAWGPSSNINVLGLVLGSLVFWFFGDDLEFRLGRRRFILFLLTSSAAGFLVSWAWSRAFSGHVASLAPNLAWALALAACRLHRNKLVVWKNYGLGKVAVLFYLLLGGLAVQVLLTWVSDEPMDQSLGFVATVVTAAFFLEPRWPARLRAWWILRRNRFGKRGGRWGYN